MRNIYLLVAFVVFSLGFACSSDEPGSIKPDSNSKSKIVKAPSKEDFRTANREDPGKSFSFPISDKEYKISSLSQRAKLILLESLTFHWRATGYFPDNLKDFVNSGFPLTWPRDLITGEPVKLFDVESIFDPAGSFDPGMEYEKINNDRALLKYIEFDLENTTDALNDPKWKIRMLDEPGKSIPGDPNRTMIVDGATKMIPSVEDDNKRLIFAMVAQIVHLLGSRTSSFLIYNDDLPQNMDDLLDARQFIITDNLINIANLLKSANAEFFWGYDYSKGYSYSYLSIDGEVLIRGCTNWQKETPDSYGCDIDTLDTSSPLITTDLHSLLEISEKYKISVQDIPVND